MNNKNRHNGMVSITIIILCTSVLLLSSYSLFYSNLYYESHHKFVLSQNCQNVALQAQSFLDFWFLGAVKSGTIPSPVSPRNNKPYKPDYSPVYKVKTTDYKKLSEINKNYRIEMYIVNANYGGILPEIFNKTGLLRKDSRVITHKNSAGNDSKYGFNGYYSLVFIRSESEPGLLYVYKKEFYGLKDKTGNVSYHNNIISILSLADKDK